MGCGDGVSLCFRSLPREIRAALRGFWSGTSCISDELSRRAYPSFWTRVLRDGPSLESEAKLPTPQVHSGVHEAGAAIGFGKRALQGTLLLRRGCNC